MTTTGQVSVKKQIVVDVAQEHAFRVFTEGLDRWWFRTHPLGSAEMQRAVLECRAGGRWYEVGVDGSQCDWGRVLAWEPPARIVLAWQISSDWDYDPELMTEVEVRFTPEGATRTRVDLEHRYLERYGDAEEQIRTTLSGPGGWQGLLEAFAAAAAG